MAKTGAEPPGTSGSQFFVVTGADIGLPPDYALLGNVTEGIDVVEKIDKLGDPADQAGTPTKKITIDKVTIAKLERRDRPKAPLRPVPIPFQARDAGARCKDGRILLRSVHAPLRPPRPPRRLLCSPELRRRTLLRSRPPARRWSWTAVRTSRSSSWAACPQDIDRDLGDRDHGVHGARRGLRQRGRLPGRARAARRTTSRRSAAGSRATRACSGTRSPTSPTVTASGRPSSADIPGRIAFMTLTTGFLPRPAALRRHGGARPLRRLPRQGRHARRHASTHSRTCAASRRSHRSTRSSAIWSRSPRASRRSSGWRQATSKARAARPSRRRRLEPRPGWRSQAARAAWAGSPTAGRAAAPQSFAVADDVAASIAETNARIQSARAGAARTVSPRFRLEASRIQSSSARGRTPAAPT